MPLGNSTGRPICKWDGERHPLTAGHRSFISARYAVIIGDIRATTCQFKPLLCKWGGAWVQIRPSYANEVDRLQSNWNAILKVWFRLRSASGGPEMDPAVNPVRMWLDAINYSGACRAHGPESINEFPSPPFPIWIWKKELRRQWMAEANQQRRQTEIINKYCE